MPGEELTADLLRYAYLRGIFPMTMSDGHIGWFQPYRRALFPIEGIHVSHSLRKTIKKGAFTIRFDEHFEQVMEGCFRPDDNWLSPHFVRAYTEAFEEGWAHCCEVWQGDELVGGIYGLALGSCFSAESMFHRVTDASKVALKEMIDKCRELGFTVFDAQVMNPHLKSLGAYEVPHEEYMRLLDRCLRMSNSWDVFSTINP